jgi:hypothetical protein
MKAVENIENVFHRLPRKHFKKPSDERNYQAMNAAQEISGGKNNPPKWTKENSRENK